MNCTNYSHCEYRLDRLMSCTNQSGIGMHVMGEIKRSADEFINRSGIGRHAMDEIDSSDDEFWNRKEARAIEISDIVGNGSVSNDVGISPSQSITTKDQSPPSDDYTPAGAQSGWNSFSLKKRRLVSILNDPPDNGCHLDSSSSASSSDSKGHDYETEVLRPNFLIENDDLAIDVDGEGQVTPDDIELQVGQRIAKKFEDGDIYFGKIVDAYDHKTGRLWHVSYDDGDSEDLGEQALWDAYILYDEFRQKEFEDVLWYSKVVVLRHHFIVEKENFLSELPKNIKANFLELGFARWASKYLPVMYLGPYDVSPGAIRQEWVENYRKHKQCIDKMPRLVYWYGSRVQRCFSFVEPKDCMSLSDGIERGFCKIPIVGEKKSTYTTPLNKKWTAFMKDISLPPKGRKGGPKLRESHELVEDRLKLLVEVEAERRLQTHD